MNHLRLSERHRHLRTIVNISITGFYSLNFRLFAGMGVSALRTQNLLFLKWLLRTVRMSTVGLCNQTTKVEEKQASIKVNASLGKWICACSVSITAPSLRSILFDNKNGV